MVKVSVVVPVYNAQEYLVDCIESLVNQTLDNIELLFVDDGSTDNSSEILRQYQEKFSDRVRVLTKENGGQASARNLGIAQCKGEYIGFVDADDCVEKCMFEKMYMLAKKEQSDYVECQYQYLKVSGANKIEKLPCYGYVRPYSDKREMFIDPLVSPWNKLYRAELLRENNITFPDGVVYEDTAFYAKTIPFICKSSFDSSEYVYHFLRQGSTMNAKKDARVGNIFPVIQDILDFYKENHLWDEYQAPLEYFCIKILLCSSLARIAKVCNPSLKKHYVQETIDFIRINFPNYRHNAYIRNSKKGIYMRCVNFFTIHIIVLLLGLRKEN